MREKERERRGERKREFEIRSLLSAIIFAVHAIIRRLYILILN